MQTDNTYTFKLTMGDVSGDGHMVTEDVVISSNVPVEQVRQAYDKACKESGLKPDQEMFEEYEEMSLDEDVTTKLVELGFDPKQYQSEYVDEDDEFPEWDIEGFVRFILDFIMRFNPGIELKQVDMLSLNYAGSHLSFGYGLLSR